MEATVAASMPKTIFGKILLNSILAAMTAEAAPMTHTTKKATMVKDTSVCRCRLPAG